MFSIEIVGSEKNLAWSSGHYVPDNIKCKRLHGHDYSIDVNISNLLLRENGMTMDFTIIKEIIRPLIGKMDHKFIVPEKDLRDNPKDNNFYDVYVNGEYKASIKKDEVFIFQYEVASAEYIAKYFHKKISEELGRDNNDFHLKIKVHEGPGNIAIYSE